jgi:hypothetical protein
MKSHRGLANFTNIYKPLVDTWILYDNSGPIARKIDWGGKI